MDVLSEWFGLKAPEGRLVLVSTPIPGQRDLFEELRKRECRDVVDGD